MEDGVFNPEECFVLLLPFLLFGFLSIEIWKKDAKVSMKGGSTMKLGLNLQSYHRVAPIFMR